jgi:hypothetical protein
VAIGEEGAALDRAHQRRGGPVAIGEEGAAVTVASGGDVCCHGRELGRLQQGRWTEGVRLGDTMGHNQGKEDGKRVE